MIARNRSPWIVGLLAIATLLPAALSPAIPDCGSGTGSSRFEIACAVYRQGGWVNNLGHAGVYYRWNPDTGRHEVIEMDVQTAFDYYVAIVDYNDGFLEGHDDYGHYEPPGLSPSDRNLILENALLLVLTDNSGVDNYSLDEILRCDEFHAVKCPNGLADGSIQATEIEEIRCDGVVEYAYEAGTKATSSAGADGPQVWAYWSCGGTADGDGCDPGTNSCTCMESPYWNVAVDLIKHQNLGGAVCVLVNPGQETGPVIQAGRVDSRVTTMRSVRARSLGITWVDWNGGPDESIKLKFSKYVPTQDLLQKKFVITGSSSGTHDYDLTYSDQGKVGVLRAVLDPAESFDYGETVTVRIAKDDLHDAAHNALLANWSDSKKVNDAPPPLPDSMTITEVLDPDHGPGERSIEVRGKATYNTGKPVTSATVEIWWDLDSSMKWTTPVAADGTYSRYITAPDRSQYVKVHVDDKGAGRNNPDEPLTASNQAWYTVEEDDPNGYTLVRTTTCKDVEGAPDYDPIDETPAFRTDDYISEAWTHVSDVGEYGVTGKWKWYRPDGTWYDTCEGEWSGSGPFDWYKTWCGIYIEDHTPEHVEGSWLVKYYVKGGVESFDLVDSRTFAVRYDLKRHVMCKDVDEDNESLPVGETNVFYQGEERAITWAEYSPTAQAFTVKWRYYEPNGALYDEFDRDLDDPPGLYYEWYRVWGWIWIDGHAANGKTGQWRVDVLATDADGSWDKVYTDYFEIREKPDVDPTASSSRDPENVLEGEEVTLSVHASDNTYLGSVELHWGIDSASNVEEWEDLNTGSFDGSKVVGPFSEGDTLVYYARAVDNSKNAYRETEHSVTVKDDDTEGPAITDVEVTDEGGNGDGYVDATEEVRISWHADDPSGVQECRCFIGGEERPVQGGYYCVGGPYAAGLVEYEIRATDGDNSPETTVERGRFAVVTDEDGDGVYDDGDESGVAGDAPCGGGTATCDDNCPDVPNADQADTDGDGWGDACDAVDGDARRLAFVVEADEWYSDLYLIGWDGTKKVLLSHQFSDGERVRAVALSHRGDRLAYLDDDQVWVMDLATGDHMQLREGVPAKSQLAWTPDDSRVLYSEGGSIWSLDADGPSEPRQEIGPTRAWMDGMRLSRETIWFVRDGNVIAFQEHRGEEDATIHQEAEGVVCDGLRVTDTGRRRTWVRVDTDRQGAVVVGEEGSADTREVVASDPGGLSPVLDVEGEWVAYARDAGDGTWEVRKVRFDGTEDTLITTVSGRGIRSLHASVLTANPDRDDDGKANWRDNCPDVANPGQEDLDGDGTGNACDIDADGDGYDIYDPGDPNDTDGRAADCEDLHADAHPGAPEVACDGIDGDCDGLADDHPDADDDGYDVCAAGDPGDGDGQPADCADDDATIHPGANEIECDAIDQDCDGLADDHADADGDGYDVCDPDEPGDGDGREADCDDTTADVHPDLEEGGDRCSDGLDNDCDLFTDDDDESCIGDLESYALVFRAGSKENLEWQAGAKANRYGIYRGEIRPGGFECNHRCAAAGVHGTSAVVAEQPAPGRAFYYLVEGFDASSPDWTAGGVTGPRSGSRTADQWCGKRLYVDPDATGAADGSSWEDAYTKVSAALAHEHSRSRPFTIWIRQDVGDDEEIEIEQSARFVGGFAGTESEPWDRSADSPRTTWSVPMSFGYHESVYAHAFERISFAEEIRIPMEWAEDHCDLLVSDCEFGRNGGLTVQSAADRMSGADIIVENSSFTGGTEPVLDMASEGDWLDVVVRACDIRRDGGTAIRLEYGGNLMVGNDHVEIVGNMFHGGATGVRIGPTSREGGGGARYTGTIGANLFEGFSGTAISLGCNVWGHNEEDKPNTCEITVDVVGNTFVDNDGNGVDCEFSVNCGDTVEGTVVRCEPRVWNNVFSGNGGYALAEADDDAWCAYGDPEFVGNDLHGNGHMYLDEGTTTLDDIDEVNGLDEAWENVSVEPGFVDAAGGDYHLRGDSSLIDAGVPGFPGAWFADMDGECRLLDGDHDGTARPDIGADEVP